jgi:tetrapyrrole methylase family protein/MazG family protein
MDLSLVASVFSTLRLDPPSRLVLLEAWSLRSAHVPPTPPDCPTLLIGIDSAELAVQIKAILLTVYPQDHPVNLVEGQNSQIARLSDLGSSTFNFQPSTCVYIPSLGEGTSFESFTEIVAHLRAPEDGCPWDKEQTHASLRTHLLEETYETLSALDSGDKPGMREEFGDLLLQIMLNSQIANEAGDFNVNAVVKGVYDKIVRRHPHVFGDVEVSGVDGVLQNWEKLKEKERSDKKEAKGLLDGVPAALPALIQAQEYQVRAARVGFDWPEIEGVLDKIAEEIQEVKEATEPAHIAEELGDLLFALVNLARWKKVDAESALRGTNLKFKTRFAHIEAGAKQQERNLSDLSLDEMEALWQEAKKK